MRRNVTLLSIILFLTTSLSAQEATKSDTTKTQKLKEVVVTHQKQLIKNDIDKLTYNVKDDVTAQTKNTLEVLKKVPFVTVDGQDNIKVQGSTNFKVYKNGHPDPAFAGQSLKEILKAMPASTIKRIEVITDPGAKYDAEGTSTILNIVMMSNVRMQGLSGNIQTNVSSYGSVGLGTTLTTQVGKLTTTINYMEYYQAGKQTEREVESSFTYLKTGEKSLEKSHHATSGNIHIGNVSASYELDSLNLLTASASLFGYKVGNTVISNYERWDKNNHLLYQYDESTAIPHYSYFNIGGRLDYQHKTHLDGEVLTLSYMLAATRHRKTNRIELSNLVNAPFNYTACDLHSRERFTEHTFQLDYVRPFGKQHKLESGLKYILRNNNSHTRTDYTGSMPNEDKEFKHNTQVAAAYLSYLFTAGNWSARAGLRYEYSHMKADFPDGSGTGFHTNLHDWVPSASVQYKITDAQTIKFSYSTSINRPGIKYLNPAVVRTPNYVSYGNANLGSSHNQKLQMTYTLIIPKLTWSFTPYYSFTNNAIIGTRYTDGQDIVATYDNVMKKRSLGFSSYTQWQPFKGTSLRLNGAVNYSRISIPSPAIQNRGCWGDIYFDVEQKLPWKLTFDMNLYVQFGRPVYTPYLYGDRWNNYIFNLTRRFLKDKLTLTLYSKMPFTKRQEYNTRTVKGDFIGQDKSWGKPREFGISLSWNFGKLRANVKKVDRSIKNDDLVGGMKQ